MEEYKILEKLGSGTYGNVYQIYHDNWPTLKAVKRFKKIYKSKEEADSEIEVEFLR
jgi:serine/threonine protein kinase